ncbi:hypothetical protein HHK36_010137 [Tetracentron sinense]|uniref:ZF-HD dimerization-type domain-containing protein n=1 Tax=Tetracentron sinense TaxID=13715 RepID=A0A834ZEG8_TETSI|nr:hypothetical protein HHK36_010137 [Tetracentron sinense]
MLDYLLSCLRLGKGLKLAKWVGGFSIHKNHGRFYGLREMHEDDGIEGAPVAPIVGGSNSRTPTRRTTTKTAISTRYRECLKNHAASIGGHVVDGCGEFMPSGEEGTPEALKCAACECHRNFHRKEIDGEPQSGTNCYYYYNPNSKNNSRRSTIPQLPPQLPAPPLQHHQKFPLGLPTSPSAGPFQPMMMAFGGGGATESSSEDINVFNSSAGGVPPHQPPLALSKKRFRTKFSQDQKGKMMEFAEKVGWRIQKQDEPLVLQFCAEVGVKKQVFKVWMHNNKHSMKNKPL